MLPSLKVPNGQVLRVDFSDTTIRTFNSFFVMGGENVVHPGNFRSSIYDSKGLHPLKFEPCLCSVQNHVFEQYGSLNSVN